MTELLFPDKTQCRVRAMLIGERLSLKSIEAGSSLALTPLVVAVDGCDGVAVLFRYGAVVLFGVDDVSQAAFLSRLQPLVKNAYALPVIEEMDLRVDAHRAAEIKGTTIFVVAGTVERCQVIADVLAKSAILTLYESKIAGSFDQIEPVAAMLKRDGQIGGRSKELVRHIGATLLSEHMMVGRVAIAEKPEVLWENTALEGLFIRLEDEFEIKERHDALERKLNLITRSAETLVDLLHNRHSMRLEWYVIALIGLEILLSLYDLFLR
jgi:uncharacterized Rmd1/YagE family protein